VVIQRLIVTAIIGGLASQGVSSSAAAQSNSIPLSVALRTLTMHAFDGFIEDRGNRTSRQNGVAVYDMAFTIDGMNECQIRVREGSGGSPGDVATCKGYTGADPSLAAAAFASLLGQLRRFVGKTAYIQVANTTEESSKLPRAEYETDNRALVTIDMTERSSRFELIVSVRPVFSL
jgi:hypothetical protein